MLKVVVFDSGWGGEVVANYLENELQVVEIIRAIDWKNIPYERLTLAEIRHHAEIMLRKYIGKVDLIVFGGYITTLAALNYFEQRYPLQKFVGLGVNYYRILKSRHFPEHVTVMMDNLLLGGDICKELRRNLPNSTIIVPDCSGWEMMTNAGELSQHILRSELEPYFLLYNGRTGTRPRKPWNTAGQIKSDVVLLLNTHYWEVKQEIEQLFGYSVRVMDFREKLLHDVCFALGLLGVDGRRSK